MSNFRTGGFCTPHTPNQCGAKNIQLIGCTKDFPETWNDKTTVLYDDYTQGVYEANILPNYEFELLQ